MRDRTPGPAPMRGWTPNPDGSVVLSPRAVKALQTLIMGDNEDRSPTIKQLDRALDEAGCDETDKHALLFVLGVTDSP